MSSIIKKYIDYLNDNPNHYWFKRKLYGYGWTPATREGWGISVLWVAIVIWNFRRLDALSHSGSDTLLNFVPQTIVLILILMAICYKTGEKPKWQWNIPQDNSEHNTESK